MKRVGKLRAKGESQLLDYCVRQGVPLAVLTDGRTWNFYFPAGVGSFDRRRFARADLAKEDPTACAGRLGRYLSRKAVVSGQGRRDANADYEAHLQQLAPEYPARAAKPPSPDAAPRPLSGESSFVLFGTARTFGSNRSMMLALLEELANRDPAFCANYAHLRTDVKRRREDFGESGRRNAHVLPGGWWARHGGSVAEQRRRVAAACQAAGLAKGRDLLVSLRQRS